MGLDTLKRLSRAAGYALVSYDEAAPLRYAGRDASNSGASDKSTKSTVWLPAERPAVPERPPFGHRVEKSFGAIGDANQGDWRSYLNWPRTAS